MVERRMPAKRRITASRLQGLKSTAIGVFWGKGQSPNKCGFQWLKTLMYEMSPHVEVWFYGV